MSRIRAFPCEYDNGMLLRDYFAAKALPSIIELNGTQLSSEAIYEITRRAYEIADAMMEARTNS